MFYESIFICLIKWVNVPPHAFNKIEVPEDRYLTNGDRNS